MKYRELHTSLTIQTRQEYRMETEIGPDRRTFRVHHRGYTDILNCQSVLKPVSTLSQRDVKGTKIPKGGSNDKQDGRNPRQQTMKFGYPKSKEDEVDSRLFLYVSLKKKKKFFFRKDVYMGSINFLFMRLFMYMCVQVSL